MPNFDLMFDKHELTGYVQPFLGKFRSNLWAERL